MAFPERYLAARTFGPISRRNSGVPTTETGELKRARNWMDSPMRYVSLSEEKS